MPTPVANRTVPTTPPVTGADMFDDLNLELAKLYDASVLPLTSIGGTADAITAQCDPAMTGGLVNGMKFGITPTGANTITGFTLRVDGPGGTPTGTAKSVVDRDGNAIPAGQWVASRRHVLEYDSGLDKFRVLDNIEPTPTAAIAQPSFRNVLMDNGGLEIWQRGAGDSASIAVGASTTAYTADRWYLTTNANQASVVSAQAGLTDRSRKCARVQRNSGQTGTASFVFTYPLTTEECVRLRGSKIAFQFVARAGANFSPTSGTVSYGLYLGTGTEGKRGAGFTGETTHVTSSVNLTAGGAAVAVTAVSSGTVATNVTQGEFRFSWTPTGTAGAADYVEIDNCQLEANTAAADFEYAPFAFMLAQCQRHYLKTFPYATAPAQNAGTTGALQALAHGDASSSARAVFYLLQLLARMRTTPTVTTYNPSAANANWRNSTTAADVTVSVGTISDSRVPIGNAVTAPSPSTLADNFLIHAQADAGL